MTVIDKRRTKIQLKKDDPTKDVAEVVEEKREEEG